MEKEEEEEEKEEEEEEKEEEVDTRDRQKKVEVDRSHPEKAIRKCHLPGRRLKSRRKEESGAIEET